MITWEELERRTKIVHQVLAEQFSPRDKSLEPRVETIPEDYIADIQARKFIGASNKELYRRMKLYGMRVLLDDKRAYYHKDDLARLKQLRKPKGMKAIGLGVIHKAVVERLQREYEIELEKRFEDFNLPVDVYIPNKNVAIEIQGPQHFFLATNWTDRNLEKASQGLCNQIERDNAKIDFCKSIGVDLIWITVDSDVDDLFKYLNDGSTSATWLHRGHLPFEEWESNFEKWMLFSYKKQDFEKIFSQESNK